MYRIFGNVQNFSYQKFFIIGSSRSTFVSIQEGGRKGTKKVYGTFLLIVSWKLYRRLKKFGEYIHKR